MNKKIYLTVDLGFGDSGKGTIVDYLAQKTQAHTVVRFNGGAQAGHRVVMNDGREHVFSQFGSGTLAGADTFLSRFMLVEPLAMVNEAEHLESIGVPHPLSRISIDPQAPITTPFHRAVNRLKELARGDSRHGSCGMGIGETMVDLLAHPGRVIRVGDLSDQDILSNKLLFVQTTNQAKLEKLMGKLPHHPQVKDELDILYDTSWVDFLVEEYSEIGRQISIVSEGYLENILNRDGAVIFEAAQGVLLDEWYGFHPHTTWSTTTLANAEQLLHEAHYDGAVERIGISRAYSTRHGAGPLITEDEQLTQLLPDACNGDDAWQASFRSGWLDLVMLDYAVRVNHLPSDINSIALTCLDRLQELSSIKVCVGYQIHGQVVRQLPIKKNLRNLQAQEKLTALLRNAEPILEIVERPTDLLSLVEQTTNTPISILSNGPTAGDKAFVKHQERKRNRPIQVLDVSTSIQAA